MGLKLFYYIAKIFSGNDATTNVSSSNNCADNIPLVDKNVLEKERNIDNIRINNNNQRNEKYKKLEDFCIEYSIGKNPQEGLKILKEMNFLEEITGKKNLSELNDVELNAVFVALDNVMKRDWKAFWKERNAEDIQEIITETRSQLNRSKVHANRLGQTITNVTTEKTLADELAAKKIIPVGTDLDEISDEDFKNYVKQYVQKEFLNNIDNCSKRKAERKYEHAKRKYVYFVNKFQTPREKAIWAAAISELDANSQALLTEISLDNCGTDGETKAEVAKTIFYSIDTTKEDALGNVMSQDDAASIYHNSHRYMTKEDNSEALNKMQIDNVEFMEKYGDKIDSLKQKRANGETLTPEEEAILIKYENVIVAHNSGAMTGISLNTYYSSEEAKQVVSNIINNIEVLGIEEDVCKQVQNYIKQNPEKFNNASHKEVIKLIDEKVTHFRTKNKQKSSQRTSAINEDKAGTENNSIKTTSQKENKDIKVENNSSEKNNTSSSKKTSGYTTVPQEQVEKDTPRKKDIVTHCETENKTTSSIPKTSFKKDNLVTFIRAEGQIEGYKEYKKEHGEQVAIVEALTNLDVTNENVIKKDFTRQNSSKQVAIIKHCGTNLDKPLEWAKNSTVLKLDGKLLSCSYATKKAQEAVDKLYEEKEC